MMRGKYIAFEGLEGCGKSTHVTRLAAGLDGVATREPGGTPIGASLRAAMLDANNTSLSPRAEALMMAADRAQHMQDVILPAIQSGRHVVSDRSVYSSLAYQGYGRELGPSLIRGFNSWAIQDTWPDLVVYIEVPTDVLLERLKKRELDRFEREDRGFFDRVAEGFRAMAAAEPYRWLVVDGMPPKDELAATIHAKVVEHLHLGNS